MQHVNGDESTTVSIKGMHGRRRRGADSAENCACMGMGMDMGQQLQHIHLNSLFLPLQLTTTL